MLNDMLGVAVGIFIVYLLLSLTLSIFIDWWSWRRGWRAGILKEWIQRLLADRTDSGIVREIYEHPLIRVLFGEKGDRPASIPPRNFALALLDVLAPSKDTQASRDLSQVRETIRASDKGNEYIRNTLLVLIDEAQGSFDKAIRNIEEWFNDPCHTSATRYRWRVQVAVFIVALAICSVLNLDTIMIADELWRQPALRESAVAAAEGLYSEIEGSGTGTAKVEPQSVLDILEESHIPVGWCSPCEAKDPRHLPRTKWDWVLKAFGVLATTLSTSLGAPFWFDLLRKIIGIRRGLEQSESGKGT
jgi:hypothetical protein